MQGWRKTMEDASIAEVLQNSKSGKFRILINITMRLKIILNFLFFDIFNIFIPIIDFNLIFLFIKLRFFTFLLIGKEVSLFAVFDGHGGNQVAEFVKDHFVNELISNENYENENYEEALKETFIKMDELMKTEEGDNRLKKYTKKDDDSGNFNAYSGMDSASNVAFCCGCTACVCLIVGNKIYCANAGDSRAVISQSQKKKCLSTDHKPSKPEEEQRIKEAGGMVSMDRVNGNLNLSRALGDFTYKQNKEKPLDKQMVLCIPDIFTTDITEETQFLIIACDGIWD